MGEQPPAAGLDGVVAAETALCCIDGEAGRLRVRGHDVEQLAGRVGFEAFCALLWDGALPRPSGALALRAELGAARVRAFEWVAELAAGRRPGDGMDALRSGLARLSPGHDERETRLALCAAPPVFAAAWERRGRGQPPLPPDPALSQAADYLRMLDGHPADAPRVAALEGYLVTLAEHDLMPSTFAARVVASTGSDPVSAVVAAVGALKGPAHGGAPGPVLDMLAEVGAPERAAAWVEARLEAGEKIMGMGHRVYRTRDPRAAVLERILEKQGLAAGPLAVARAIESAAEEALERRRPGRRMRANVELYAAVLLDALGLPRSLFTPTYAMASVPSWLAHVREQVETGRLIRPRSRYVGPETGR